MEVPSSTSRVDYTDVSTTELSKISRRNEDDHDLGPSRKRVKRELEATLAHDKPTESAIALMDYIPAIKDDFFVVTKVGSGTFSAVYLCYRRNKTTNSPGDKLALKCIIPTCHPERISMEIKCLRKLGGSHNVMGLTFCAKYNNSIVIGMPYFPHDVFSVIIQDMTIVEIQLYMKNLFIALARIHSIGIIHRDLKPINFLYNRAQKTFSLIDFGLAQSVKKPFRYFKKGPSKIPTRTTELISKKVSIETGKRPVLGVLSPSKLNAMQQNSHMERIRQTDQKEKKFLMLSVPTQPGVTKNIAGVKVSSHLIGSKVSSKYAKAKAMNSSKNDSSACKICNCFGKPEFCRICTNRKRQVAPRAGTPGFRAPEVLFKYEDQTTAIDMWSAGVMFLCMLTRRYPFFRAPEDMTALAEITTLFGSSAMKRAAKCLNKDYICRPEVVPLDLSHVLPSLRYSNDNVSVSPNGGCEQIPPEAYSLLTCLMELNYEKRITASEALLHPFISL